MEDGTEKETIQGLLREILDAIEQLHDLRQFGGSAEKFFTLIDKYSHLRPVSVACFVLVSFVLFLLLLFYVIYAFV